MSKYITNTNTNTNNDIFNIIKGILNKDATDSRSIIADLLTAIDILADKLIEAQQSQQEKTVQPTVTYRQHPKTNLDKSHPAHSFLNQMKFVHARWIQSSADTKIGKTAIHPHGGYTFAVRDNLDGTLTFACSRCSDEEVFCKMTGRDIAMDRLSSPKYAKTIKSTFNAFRDDVSLALDFLSMTDQKRNKHK